MRKWLEISLHVLFWLLSLWVFNQAFAMETVQEVFENGEQRVEYSVSYTYFFPILYSLAGLALLAYGHAFWALPRFLRSKEWPPYLRRVLALWGGALLLNWALNQLHNRLAGEPLAPYVFPPLPLNTLLSGLYLSLSIAYRLGKNYLHDERLKQQLREEQLAAELRFLKSQINPHFLFNTLNNLFALAERKDQPELSQGIAELANLMRYVLYDGQAERVPLEKEIRFLESLIEIQQLRLDEQDEVVIGLNVRGDYQGRQIAPLILIPFVENAFKHGIYPPHPSVIRIDFEVSREHLRFQVSNPVFSDRENELPHPSGIGLENVRRRLALLYPERHELRVEQKGGIFTVELALDLEDFFES